MQGFICGPRLYRYDGWFFEWHSYCGPWPLRQDGELRARAGRQFWQMIRKFEALSKDKQESCRIGGGCTPFRELRLQEVK